MLIVQSANNPTRIRNALADLIAQGVRELHVASAYLTHEGSKVLLDQLRDAVGTATFEALPKRLVTSFDFGLTQPEALRYWQGLAACEVRVAGAEALARGRLVPSRAFHPKLYIFRRSVQVSGLLVGSANLTARGLTVNTEVAWQEDHAPSAAAMAAFEGVIEGTVPLTDDLLQKYEILRRQQPAPREIRQEAEPVEQPAPVNAAGLPEFRRVVESGALNLAEFDRMWVQGEGMQGGSQNQLELPRGAHRFFQFVFDGYNNSNKVTIGRPVLRSAGKVWDDRLLTWHGNNMMERLNLPTLHQGGFSYVGQAVMFRRLADGAFELTVVPWDSDLARAWRQASAENGLLFKLGSRGNRLAGLI